MYNDDADDFYIFNQNEGLIQRYEQMLQKDHSGYFEEEEFEWIVEYFESRNELSNALQALDYAISQYAFSASFLIKKAELFFEGKEIQKAFDFLDHATVLDTGELDIYLLRSEIYVFQGNFDEAVSILKHAMQIADPEELDIVYLSLAEVYETWEKFELAYQSIKKVLEINPENEEGLNRIWFYVNITEKYGESIEFHKKLIDNNPYSYLAWYNLGHAYFGLGLYEKACDAFEYVTLINEDYDLAYRDWGEALIKSEKIKDAIEVFESALKIAEPYEEIYFGLGVCYEKLNQAGKARYYFRKAVQYDPYYDEALFRLAENYAKEGLFAEALSNYKKALKINEDSVDYLKGFAKSSYSTGQIDEAINNYKRIISLEPNSPDYWITLSKYQIENGETLKAIETIEEALVYCGENDMIYYYKSACEFIAGKRNAAFEDLNKALTLNPGRSQLLFDYYPELMDDSEVNNLVEMYRS
jgi:tetratricopeptide (TPR) repeat protein